MTLVTLVTNLRDARLSQRLIIGVPQVNCRQFQNVHVEPVAPGQLCADAVTPVRVEKSTGDAVRAVTVSHRCSDLSNGFNRRLVDQSDRPLKTGNLDAAAEADWEAKAGGQADFAVGLKQGLDGRTPPGLSAVPRIDKVHDYG